jgi:hypothetical protein
VDPDGTGLISAALRHVVDAEHLLTQGPNQSVDQAWHLAGFGPECARKAVFSSHWRKTLGHAIGGGDPEIQLLDWCAALDGHAARFGSSTFASSDTLTSWGVESRYDRSGTRTLADCAELFAAAKREALLIAARLWSSGETRCTP